MGKRKALSPGKKATPHAITPATLMDAPISNSEMIKLCINSNKNTDDGAEFDDGHAWLTVDRKGKTDGYGLWPDVGDTDNLFAGLLPDDTSDVRHNNGIDAQRGRFNYCESITEEQFAAFEALRQDPAFWSPTNNCSSWASATFTEVTGVDVDADDEWILGVETPRELGQNITRLNQQRSIRGIQP